MYVEDAEDVEFLVRGAADSPLTLALVAFIAMDEDTLRHVSLSVNAQGGVSVNMHGHQWAEVIEMVNRLHLPHRPASVAPIVRTRWATTFAQMREDGRPDRSLQVVWFHD
jgi:hypothetical protein